jgi:hypothetical protein
MASRLSLVISSACPSAIAVPHYVAEIGNPDRGNAMNDIRGVASSKTNRDHGSLDGRPSKSTGEPGTQRTNADVRRRRTPGDLVVRPLAVVALTTLIVNDHVIRPRLPGLLSGKLSDIAGLVLLPILIVSVYEVTRAAVRRPWQMGARGVVAIAVAVVIGFAATKLSTAVAASYGDMLGWLRWPLIGHWSQVAISQDPTDVICTPAAIVAWIELRRFGEV